MHKCQQVLEPMMRICFDEKEREKKYLTLKDMKSGKQEDLTLEKLIEKLKNSSETEI